MSLRLRLTLMLSAFVVIMAVLAVGNGERPADAAEKERLKARCDTTLDACREAHLAWWGAEPAVEGQR